MRRSTSRQPRAVQPELRRNTWPRDNVDALEVPVEIERHVKFLADLTARTTCSSRGTAAVAVGAAVLGERRTGVVRLARGDRGRRADPTSDENAAERESFGHQLHARNLEFDEVSAAPARSRIVLVGVIVAVGARLAEVEADLGEVQTPADATPRRSSAARATTPSLERSYPVRIARVLKRLRRR